MIDLNKKYKTREGNEVKLYTIWPEQQKGPIHGAVKNPKDGGWYAAVWPLDGRYFPDKEHYGDLIEVKEPTTHKYWIAPLKNGNTILIPDSTMYEEVLRGPLEDFIAIVPVEITYSEGDGL